MVIDKTNVVINKVENSTPSRIKKNRINFNVHVGFQYRMPFIKYDEGKPWVDNGRIGFIFQVAGKDINIFGEILDIAKVKELWRDFWGCFCCSSYLFLLSFVTQAAVYVFRTR